MPQNGDFRFGMGMEDAVNSVHGTAVYFESIDPIPEFHFILNIFTEIFQIDLVFPVAK